MHELLAPVGNFQMLQAAINAGADAVYLSGYKFGARTDKANFSHDELKLAVETAHLYKVKVYITLNTLVKQAELDACFNYIDQLAAMSVDAIILQDLGIIRYIRHTYPTIECHGSTQMGVHNLSGVKNVAKLGLKRVVVARETPLSVIDEMLALDLIELEVFVHGALCYAYSGQCLLSSTVGGRSGNRGRCAQPCRLNYQLNEQNFAAMNMADLSTIDQIDQLIKRPISAFKIEGRLRHADYVYHTVKAYHMALCGVNKGELQPYIKTMYQVFNRTYTKGHLLNDRNRLNLVGGGNKGQYIGKTLKSASKYKLKIKLNKELYIGDALKIISSTKSFGIEIFNIYKNMRNVNSARSGEVVEIDYNGYVKAGLNVYRTKSNLLSRIRMDKVNAKNIAIDMFFRVDDDYKMTLQLNDGINHIAIQSDDDAQIPKKYALTESDLYKNLAKLGDTPFLVRHFSSDLSHPIYVTASALNTLRRRATDKLVVSRQKTVYHIKNKSALSDIRCHDSKHNSNRLVCYVSKASQVQALKTFNCTIFSDVLALCDNKTVFFAHMPFATKPNLTLQHATQMVGNVGDISPQEGIYYDGHSTVMNALAYDALQVLGANDICLSPELTESETAQLLNLRPARYWAYGKLPVMYSRSCPLRASGIKCIDCNKWFALQNDTVGKVEVTCHNKLLRYVTALPLIKNQLIVETNYNAFAFFTDESIEQVVQIASDILVGKTITATNLQAFKRSIT